MLKAGGRAMRPFAVLVFASGVAAAGNIPEEKAVGGESHDRTHFSALQPADTRASSTVPILATFGFPTAVSQGDAAKLTQTLLGGESLNSSQRVSRDRPEPVSSNKGVRMAIVRPFHDRDSDLLLRDLNSPFWHHGHVANKAPPLTDHTDLVLFYSYNLDSHVMDRLRPMAEQLQKEGSVDKVQFLAADLDTTEDVYPNAPCHQFFKLFMKHGAELSRNYDVMFYMEPDVTPLRPNWMEQLHREAFSLRKGQLWMAGPAFDTEFLVKEVGKEWLDSGAAPWYSDRHLNGNSLYCVGEPKFMEFMDQAYKEATDHCTDWRGFDHAIWQWMLNTKPELKTKFRESSFIAHVKGHMANDPTFTVSEAQRRYPESFLIHSMPLIKDQSQELQHSRIGSASTLP